MNKDYLSELNSIAKTYGLELKPVGDGYYGLYDKDTGEMLEKYPTILVAR